MALALDNFSNVNFLGSNNLSVYTTNALGDDGSGAFLPADNALVLAFVWTSGTADAGEFYWNDTTPYQFTKILDVTCASGAQRLYIFRALRSSWGATAKTASFDCTGDAATGADIRVVEITGVDTSGTNGSGAIVQNQSASDQVSANPALTLSALGSADNGVIAAFIGDTNAFGGAVESGDWTELRDGGYNTPPTGSYLLYDLATTDNTVVVTRGSNDWGGIALEIKAAATSVNGSGTPDLPDISAAGAGTVVVDGSGTPDLPEINASGAGDVDVNGTGALDLPPITSSGVGNTSNEVNGSGAMDLPPILASGAGDVDVNGTGAASLVPLSSSGAGDVDVNGAGQAGLPPILASGAGTVVVDATGAATIVAVSAGGAGDVDVNGTGASSLPPITTAGDGIVLDPVDGTGDMDLPPISSSGLGSALPEIDASGAISLPVIGVGPRARGHVFNPSDPEGAEATHSPFALVPIRSRYARGGRR